MCDSYLEPSTVLQAFSNPQWKSAMESEYKAPMQNNTWTLVPYSSDIHVVPNKWVFRTKYKANGSLDKFEARLVAEGFQEMPGVNYSETFSPVIKLLLYVLC